MTKSLQILNVKLLLIILIGSSIIYSSAEAKQLEAKAESRRIVDLCKPLSERTVVIMIDIGSVVRADSLFGFNFELSYNPEKILLHTALYTGTLADQLDTRFTRFDNENGKAWGSAANMNISAAPAAGDRALMGVVGDYIGDESDTAHVHISYIEFTDEYQNEIVLYSPAIVLANLISKSELYFNTQISDEQIEIEHNENAEVSVSFDTNHHLLPRKLTLNLEISNGDFIIEDIIIMNQDNISINVDNKQINAVIEISANDNYNIDDMFRIIVSKGISEEEEHGILKISPKVSINSTCIGTFNYAEITLIGNKKPNDTTNVITDRNSDVLAYFANDELIIETRNKGISNVRIYNSIGQFVLANNTNGDLRYSIHLSNELQTGLYFAVISFTNNTIKTIKFIK